MTDLREMRELQRKAKDRGIKVTLFFNEDGMFDQVYIVNKGLRDPLTAAEYLRRVTR